MKHTLLLCSAALLLTGCSSLFGHYERDTQHTKQFTAALYRDTTAAGGTLAIADTTSFGNLPWREVFTDPQLRTLIDTALVRNTDMRKALLTVKQAEIGLRINKLAYLPQIALSPSGTISHAFIDHATTNKTYEIPVQASWQIDAFGTLYNAKKQGELSLEQAKWARQATQTAVVCRVANLYYSLQMLDEQLATAIASAKAQVLQIEAGVPTINKRMREAENALCLLLHETPHGIQRSAFTAEGFPKSFSTGLPLSLLANRPDVAISEAKLAQAFYGIQAARGAFFPKITLSAQGQFTNSLGGMIMNPGKFIAAGVASLDKITQESAQLDFEKTLLKAGQEVSNALNAYNTACQTTDLAKQQVQQLQKAYDDTQFLFKNGNTTTYLETLNSQMSLLNGQLSLVNKRYEKVQAVISLYQALGGGRH